MDLVNRCVFFLSLLQCSVCLQCFQCSASDPDSACQSDVKRLNHDRQFGGRFAKNCSIERSQRFCLIEISHNRGQLSTFMRDCTDGHTFSFSKIDRLKTVLPTNQTTCAAYELSGTVVCVSVCSGDFCNGPLPSSGFDNPEKRNPTNLFVILLVSYMLIS